MLMKSTPQSLTRTLLRVVQDSSHDADRDLLLRFASNRDEEAFAELVKRHGRMVLAVARRVTRHPHDAEDAFQAAFLVLARRATQIKQPEQLANWLYGVAYRTALEARARRRKVLERAMPALPEKTALPDPEDTTELRQAIDEELATLPDKYRAAIVMCDLEGLSRASAATHLKIPEGTLSSRLAYGRKVLAMRLTRRGITSTAGTIATLFAGEAAGGSLPRELVVQTARVAAHAAQGGMVPQDLLSPSVSQLSERVMKIMLANRLRITAISGVLTVGLIGLGAFGFAQQPAGQQSQDDLTVVQISRNANNQATPQSQEGTKYAAKGIEDDDVPIGSLPTHAVVRIEESKLIYRLRVSYLEPVTQRHGIESVTFYEYRSQVAGLTINDISELSVFDMKGNRLPSKTWKEKLKVDTHALIAFDGKLPNPRELALFKEDTLILVLPLHSNPARFSTSVPTLKDGPATYSNSMIPPPAVGNTNIPLQNANTLPAIQPSAVLPQPNPNVNPLPPQQSASPSVPSGPLTIPGPSKTELRQASPPQNTPPSVVPGNGSTVTPPPVIPNNSSY